MFARAILHILELTPRAPCFHSLAYPMGNNDISIFNGVGFHTWQVKLTGYLMKKGLWSIINSIGGQNLTAPQQRELKEKNEKALDILRISGGL